MNQEGSRAGRQKDYVTNTQEGSPQCMTKPLFNIALDYICDNVDLIESLVGFPELVAEKIFSEAESRQIFAEPVIGQRALQKFTQAYGRLVLSSLCLQNKYMVVSEKIEEIKSFRGLMCLDLSGCNIGDNHELLEHLTREAMSSLTRLFLRDNCLSDAGLRRVTTPVRVLGKGLENLEVLDLSYNPHVTELGVRYVLRLRRLGYLDITGTGLKDADAVIKQMQLQMGFVHSKEPLGVFDHCNCRTEGWAKQTVLQWEQAAAEATKTQKDLKSALAAQNFYGQTRRREAGKHKPAKPQPEPSLSWQFYKERLQTSSSPQSMEVVGSSQLHRKGPLPDKGKDRFSKRRRLVLTADDWNLLNTY